MGDDDTLYRTTFANIEQNLSSFLEEVNKAPGDSSETAAEFDRAKFWNNITTAAQKIGFECNKICLMWVKSPPPSHADMVAMCGQLEMACLLVTSWHLNLPASEGSLLRLHLRRGVANMLEAAVKFARTLQATTGWTGASNSHPLLPECGLVMKHCDTLQTAPRTNREACSVKLKSDILTIKDALRELEEARDDETFLDEECQDGWSDSDKRLMGPLLGIIKTGGALMNKTSDTMRRFGRCEAAADIGEYDAAAERLARICPAVDDLAFSLYPPLDWRESKEVAWNLKAVLEDTMDFVSSLHFMQTEEARTWLAFIRKAVDHNVAEVQRIFIEAGLAHLHLTEAALSPLI